MAPKAVPFTKEAKTALYGELRYVQGMKGKSESWFLAQYKSIVGTWPRNVTSEPILPTRATLAKLDELNREYRNRIVRQNYARNRGSKPKTSRPVIADLFA